MAAKTSAVSVANAFLDLQAQDIASFPRIDQMKIQKLVFYAHAWHLALYDESLFEDDVEAWPWGPVVRDVYFAFKDCKRSPIEEMRATEIIRSGVGPLAFHIGPPPKPSTDIVNFLQSVWTVHKGMTGVQLSNATHADGEPWTIVKNEYPSLDNKPRIPNELIQDVFKSKLQRTQNNSSTSVNAASA